MVKKNSSGRNNRENIINNYRSEFNGQRQYSYNGKKKSIAAVK